MAHINEGTDLTVSDGVAVITLDFPPVNAMSPALMDGLYDALMAALDDDAVDAIVLMCAGRTFIAGADLKSLGKVEPKVDFFGLQDSIECSSKPTVAALHGTPLGGGLETALTFHYRIATPDTQLGLPEVNLGLLPGGGGTQRLPRICGAEAALKMLISGGRVPARKALEIGLLDRLSGKDSLRADAVAFARELANSGKPPQRIRDIEDRVAADRKDMGLFDRFRSSHADKLAGLDAPQAIVRCVEAAVKGPWEKGIEVERAEFQKLLTGPQSAALRHVFAAERAAQKIADVPKDTPVRNVTTVGIYGTGSDATSMALAFLQGGYQVILADKSAKAIGAEKERIDAQVQQLQISGILKPEHADNALQNLILTEDISKLADADMIVESAAEDRQQKQSAISEVGQLAGADTILVTSAYTLDMNAIAQSSDRPSDILGMHFLAPVSTNRLVEITRTPATAPDVLATVVKMAKKMGKAPVVSAGSTGCVAHQMLTICRRQADKMVMKGASPSDIDRVMSGFGFAAGIYQLCERISPDQQPQAERASAPGSTPLSDRDILDNILLPIINEGARLLEARVSARGSDIDLVWVAGFGWPAHKGGPMFYADTVGLGDIADQLRQAEGMELSPLLDRLATERGSLANFSN